MDDIESIVKNTLQELNLPWKERTQKRDDNLDRLRSFQTSLSKGKIGALRIQLDLQIDTLVRKLSQYLQSEEGKAHATHWKNATMKPSQQRSFDERNMEEMILHRFCAAITAFPGYEEFSQWCNDCIMSDVEKSLEELNVLMANIAGSRNTIIRQTTVTAAGQDAKSRRIAVAIAVPVLVIGFPLALAVTVVAAPIFGVFKMIGSIKELSFKKAVEKGYNEVVANACSGNCTVLKQLLMGLLKTDCLAVSLVYDTIPEKARKLDQELQTRARQEEKDIPHYKELLQRCQAIKGEMAKFTLEMNVHNNTVDDFDDLNLSSPAARGSFANVFKVNVHGKGVAALKVMKCAITVDNAEEFCRELTSCR